MIIKKYLANSLQEAEEIVKNEMGPQAIILTSRRIQHKGIKSLLFSSKVEVVAALEELDGNAQGSQKDEGFQQKSDSPEYLQKEIFDEKTILENSEPAKQTLEIKSKDPSNELNQQKLEPITKPQKLNDLRRIRSEIFERFELAVLKQKQFPLSQEAGQRIRDEEMLNSIRIEILKSQGASQYQKEETFYQAIGQYLFSKGFSTTVIAKILADMELFILSSQQTISSLSTEYLFSILRKEIASLIHTSGPIYLQDKPTLSAIIGPSGVGKTTTIFKIALAYMEALNKKVSIISIDKNHIGAIEQTSAIAEKFKIPFTFCENLESLQAAIASYHDSDIILIDTFGCGPKQVERFYELCEIIQNINQLHIHLAISATTKDLDAYASIELFGQLNLKSLIFTKLDETLAPGLLLNICNDTKMPISYLTSGPFIPYDLQVADSDEIACQILDKLSLDTAMQNA